MNLRALKEEARHELYAWLTAEGPVIPVTVIDSLIDKVVDALEESVQHPLMSEEAEAGSSFVNGKNTERRRLQEAFSKFRNS